MTMRPIELSPRLRAVAELVPHGTRFADVGTDHAYLAVWLLQRGVVRHALVSDLRQGPLERARATAEHYGLMDRMTFRLCDGLRQISPEEADTIAIAGMGGETILSILAAAPWTKESGCRLLLQPMSGQPELRLWLQENGYVIEQEQLCPEGRTLYTVFSVCPGEMAPLTPAEQWAGRQRREDRAPMRATYLEQLQRRACRAIEGLQSSKRTSDAPRLAELERVLAGLNQMAEEWKQWQR